LRPWSLEDRPVPRRSCRSNWRSRVDGARPRLRHDYATYRRGWCCWSNGCRRHRSYMRLRCCCHGCRRLRLCGSSHRSRSGRCGRSGSYRSRCRMLCRWSSGSGRLWGDNNWRRNCGCRSLRRGCGSRRRNHCRTGHDRTSRWPARNRWSSRRRRSHNIRPLTRQRNDLARPWRWRVRNGRCRCARGGAYIRYGRGSLRYLSGRRRGGRWNHRRTCDYRRRRLRRSLGLFALENRLQGVPWFGDLRQIKFRSVCRLPRGPTRATTT
jgi:hypothetical protein